MKCAKCEGEMVWGTAPVHIERNGYHLDFEKIPAWVCTQCEETYFELKEVDAIQELIRSFEQKAQELKLSA